MAGNGKKERTVEQMKANSGKKPDNQKRKNNQKQKRDKIAVGFFRGIQFKLIASFFVPVICIVALGVSSYQMAANAVFSSYQSSIEQTMQMVEDYLNLVLDTEQASYRSYLQDDELKRYFLGNMTDAVVYKGRTTTEFKRAVTGDDLLANVFFISQSEEPIATVDLTGTEAYEAFMATHQGELAQANATKYLLFGNQSDADGALGVDSSKYSMRLVKKMVDSNGFMIIDFAHNILQDSLGALNVGEGTYVGLVTCDGGEFLMENGQVIEQEEKVFSGQDFYQNAVSALSAGGDATAGLSQVSYNGSDYHFFYRALGDREAVIAVLVPDSQILAQAADIRRLTVIISVAAVIIALALGSVLAKSFGGTIRKIVKCLKKISDGDLTVEIQSRRKDEFRLLTEGISGMASHMKKLLTNVKEVSGELTTAAAEVSESSEMFMDTSKNIKDSIQEIEKGVQLLDKDSADCLNQMDGLSSKITSVTDSAAQILKMTDAAEACIAQGMNATGELTSSAVSTTRITGEVIGAVDELEQKTRSIGQIVEVINEIASQTNLLSLNASIEAARAGASGRGFAVVAEEIRKLADQSLTAAGEIAKIIQEMIQNTGKVSEIAKEAESVVATQSDAVNATIDSFREIERQVSGLLEALQLINDSVKDMDSDRSATLGSVESISSVSAQTASSSMEVYGAADKQLEAVTRLEDASEQMQKRALQLSDTLKQFKL